MTSLTSVAMSLSDRPRSHGPYSDLCLYSEGGIRDVDEGFYEKCLTRFCRENLIKDIYTATISESQFLFVLSIIESAFDKNDISEKNKFHYFHKQFVNYTALCICFERSKEYSFDKTTGLFQTHFEALQKNGYEINSIYPTPESNPLGIAVKTSMPAICQALVNLKADVYASKNGEDVSSNLLVGIESNLYLKKEHKLKCLQILLSNGCDPNSDKAAIGRFGRSIPMIFAAHRLENDIIQMLVDARGDINVYDFCIPSTKKVKTTPLLAAIASNVPSSTFASQVSTINLLVNLKADLFFRNEEGEFADEVARKIKKPELAQYLLTLQISQIRKILEELNKYLASVLSNIVIDYVVYPSRFTFLKEMLNPPALQIEQVPEADKK